ILEQYKDENDIIFFKGEKLFTKVEEGMFAIFFPADAHMPGINTGNHQKLDSYVKKIVIKVRIN
ncbi:MAG: YhcH/YjgK/YiaL family protein, partial [Ignavibacteriales bacterium]